MKEHSGLPVSGYRPQSGVSVALVNENKATEERILRLMDFLKDNPDQVDQRWLAVARTQIEQGFMALNRAIFRPERISLPEDTTPEADQ